MRRLDPRQDQKTRVVSDEPDVALPGFLAPADETIATAQMARRRTPRHAGDRPHMRPDQIFQMLAHRLLVAKIVVMLDEAVEQRLIAGAADLLHLQRSVPSNRRSTASCRSTLVRAARARPADCGLRS